MKNLFTFLLLVCISQKLFSQGFEKYYGDSTLAEKGRDLMQWSDGSIYVVGSVYNDITDYDIKLYKVNLDGDLLWSKTYTIPFNNYGYGICKSHDGNILLAGETNNFISTESNLLFLKVDTSGTLITQKIIGTSTLVESLAGFKALPDSGYVGCGFISDSLGSNDSYIFKLNNNLDIVSSRNIGIAGSNEVSDDVMLTSDGHYFLSTHEADSASTDYDFTAYYLDENFNTVWRTRYGTSYAEGCQRAIETSTGDFLMVGEGHYDDIDYKFQFILLMLNPAGDVLWFERLGIISQPEAAFDVIEHPDGGFLLVGYAKYNDTISQQPTIVKLTTDRTLEGQQYYGGTGVGIAYRIKKEQTDGWLVTGFSNYRFQDGTSSDMMILKHVTSSQYPTAIYEPTTTQTISLYPNPAQDLLHIMNLRCSPDDSYMIYNQLGQVLQSGKLHVAGIDIHNLQSQQLYVLTIQTKNGSQYTASFYKK